MPYTPAHRAHSRLKIINAARKVFNTLGFEAASIDKIMAEADMSRGGFYHHFKNKEDVFAHAVVSLFDQTADAGTDDGALAGGALIRAVMDGYLSDRHLGDVAGQCPMVAVPSDVARAGPVAQNAYKAVFEGMVAVFERNMASSSDNARRHALTLATLCVGGMVLSRAMNDEALSEEIMDAARNAPDDLGLAP